jgi:YHS domain-containing protein
MSTHHDSNVARDRDPVCGMSVRIDVAIDEGLVAEHDGHVSHFCRAACRDAFTADPGRFTAAVASAPHPHPDPTAAPTIDEGMRLWYESCSCCLSDAFPEVKAALDAERVAAAESAAGPGICEVAEAQET